MRVQALLAAALTAAIVVAVGCHHDKHQLAFTPKEEAVDPPNEPRYNNPPTEGYRKPVAKTQDKTLMNAGKMGPGPLNPGGF